MRAVLATLALAACTPAPQTVNPETAQIEAEPVRAAEPTPTATDSAENALASMPSWETARAAGVAFRAVGQEPGWLLDIYTRDKIVLVWDYGANKLELPRSAPAAPQAGVTRYESQARGHHLVVTIRATPCQDGMSGQDYPASVEVVIDGRSLNGCGRDV